MLRSKAGRLIGVAVLASLAFWGVGEWSKQGKSAGPEASPKPPAGAKDRIPATEREKVTTIRGAQDLHAHLTYRAVNEKGQDGSNFWRFLLMPAQAEWSGETKIQKDKTLGIPYEYARLFEKDPAASKPLREADREKMSRFAEDEMKRKFVDALSMWSKDVYRYHHGNPESRTGKITGIHITGYASPEGPMSKGPGTLAPENIDPENIALAKTRAENMVAFTEAELARLSKETGIDLSIIKEAVKNIDAKEDQFSLSELGELRELYFNRSGVDDAEKLFNLVADYNEGKIKDAGIIAKLDKIVGAKRRVEITVTSEGNEKSTWLIPLPLFLLLSLTYPAVRRFAQKKDENNSLGYIHRDNTPLAPPVAGEGARTEKPVDQEALRAKWRQESKIDQRIAEIPNLIKEAALPEKGTRGYEEMEEIAMIDDLYIFFDDQGSVRRGIDYRSMADLMTNDFRIFKDDVERELFLADKILKAWKKHDRESRIEAEVPAAALDDGLDYENQPNQIKWAKMHARALVTVSGEMRQLMDANLLKDITSVDPLMLLLQSHVREMINRRVARQSS